MGHYGADPGCVWCSACGECAVGLGGTYCAPAPRRRSARTSWNCRSGRTCPCKSCIPGATLRRRPTSQWHSTLPEPPHRPPRSSGAGQRPAHTVPSCVYGQQWASRTAACCRWAACALTAYPATRSSTPAVLTLPHAPHLPTTHQTSVVHRLRATPPSFLRMDGRSPNPPAPSAQHSTSHPQAGPLAPPRQTS
eukprot:COSAG02_NODE_2998_length_7580_cov_3.352493_5_plen_193_part_00